jgi:hypothetical protein
VPLLVLDDDLDRLVALVRCDHTFDGAEQRTLLVFSSVWLRLLPCDLVSRYFASRSSSLQLALLEHRHHPRDVLARLAELAGIFQLLVTAWRAQIEQVLALSSARA